MLVEVFYQQRFEAPKLMAKFDFEADSVEDALELAYRWSQNLEDSWSRPGGRDYSPNLVWVASLKVHEGQEFGHRSSMVGDVFHVSGAFYEVASCGFKPLAARDAEAMRELIVEGA